MIDVGYDAFDDPYCYKGTGILRNKAGLRDSEALEAFELEMTTLRAEEPLPAGRFGPAHYSAVHRHLFQDVYSWAGRYRTVRTSKAGNPFCFPEHIAAQMDALFAQLRAGHCFAEPNRAGFVVHVRTGMWRFLRVLLAKPLQRRDRRSNAATRCLDAGGDDPVSGRSLPRHFRQPLLFRCAAGGGFPLPGAPGNRIQNRFFGGERKWYNEGGEEAAGSSIARGCPSTGSG